jgi:hypothetical protein
MTWNGELPHDWAGVSGLLIVGLGAIALAVLPGWIQARRNHTEIRKVGRQTSDDLAAIRGQVVNGHAEDPSSPNMRDDLDVIKSVVERLEEIVERLSRQVAGLFHDQQGLRSDMLAQEEMRRLQIADVRDEIDRNRKRP